MRPMRPVGFDSATPAGAVTVVGVVGGEPLEPVPVTSEALGAMGYQGGLGETQFVNGHAGPVMLVGLGDTFDLDDLRTGLGAVGRALPVATPVATSLHRVDLDGALEAVITGLQLGSYRFDAYRTVEGSDPGDITLVGDADEPITAILTACEAVWVARDWANRPPVDKSPPVLAAEMGTWLEEAGFEVEVWDAARVTSERLGALEAVAAGSDRPPALIVARRNTEADLPHLALVGKGIVFDSGGLSIKTTEGMETMKGDMAGAAAVVAAAGAIGRLGLEVAASVFVPLSDNMSGGSAVKPGDVVKARNGKTIEVLNTDAEGRLVLADALSLAAEAEPDLIVDLATLTAAARVGLGDRIAAVFGEEEIRDGLLAAAAASGERAWALPLPADYRRMIDSTVADMKNTGGRYGGAITAALLLSEFVGDTPWVHVDIAGPSWFREEASLGPKGASGFGVRMLVALAGALSDALDRPAGIP